MNVGRSETLVRIPRLRAVVTALAVLFSIGLTVFLRRYRGADRTAMALSLLVGGALCLMLALFWFQVRFSHRILPRRALRGIGVRYGALAGALTGGIGIVLLAVRWAMDQLASPVGEPFPVAFWRALVVLGEHLTAGAVAYLAAGAMLGALVGLLIAEAVGISADRIPETQEVAPFKAEPVKSSRRKR